MSLERWRCGAPCVIITKLNGWRNAILIPHLPIAESAVSVCSVPKPRPNNYGSLSEVTRCYRRLQLIVSQRRRRENGLACRRYSPRRRMPCLLFAPNQRSWGGSCSTESRVASLRVYEAGKRYSRRPKLGPPGGHMRRQSVAKARWSCAAFVKAFRRTTRRHTSSKGSKSGARKWTARCCAGKGCADHSVAA